MPVPDFGKHALVAGTPSAAGELCYDSTTGRLYWYDGVNGKVRRAKFITDFDPPVSQTAVRALTATTATYCTPAWPIPANTLSVGDGLRIRALLNSTVATLSNLTVAVKFGTLGTTADATINGTFTTVGTAAAGTAMLTIEIIVRTLGATGTFAVMTHLENNGSTGLDNMPSRLVFNAPTVNTTVANQLGLAFTASVASVVNVQAIDYQVV